MDGDKKTDYKELARQIRKDILTASYQAGACHISSALSCVGILVDIFFKRMKKGDHFIYSKVSGAAALYAVLAQKNILKKNQIQKILKEYPLISKKIKGIEHGIGSLGHGLPVACGLAYADRTRDVYVLMSDGEIQEGTTWESFLFARQHKLKNLKIYVDRNGLQALGRTEEIIGIEKGLQMLKKLFPMRIIQTVKGAPIDFMKNDFRWHYKNLDKNLYERAMAQV